MDQRIGHHGHPGHPGSDWPVCNFVGGTVHLRGQDHNKDGGQIPAGFSQGSGTLISGPAADKATEAALAAYPGVIVDRVAKLSNGEYNVHCIGDSWPHHVFVNQDFKAVGAE